MNPSGSMTAQICLFARAEHAESSHPVFVDSEASSLIGKEGYDQIARFISNDYQAEEDDERPFDERRVCGQVECCWSPILMPRQAYAEQELSEFADGHGIIQYVILGAGMDTFAFRCRNPKIRVFELDHPDTQRFKKNRIRQLGWKVPDHVFYIPVDFTKDQLSKALSTGGYDPDIPSFFSLLGVTYYLQQPALDQMLDQISQESKPADRLVFDFPDETTFTSAGFSRAKRLSEIAASMGEVMTQGYSYETICTMLGKHHFRVNEHLMPDEIQHRWLEHSSVRAFDNVHFVLAEKTGD